MSSGLAVAARYDQLAIWPFLTQDPIGLAGGVNLYAYAGNDPISYDDPFGLCTDKDGNEVAKCRDVTPDEGRHILHAAAETGQWTWTEGDASKGQPPKDVPNHVGDCTDYCETGMEKGGQPALDPRPNTGGFDGSTDYRPLKSGEKPQMGDVVVSPGKPGTQHAGLATGQVDKNGRPRALQNGQSGTRVIAFPKNSTIYRRQTPDNQ